MKVVILAMCLITLLTQHQLRRELTMIVRKVDMKYGHLVKSGKFWQSKYYEEIRKEYSKRGLEIKERGESAVMENKVNEYYRNDLNLARHVLKSV